MFNKPASITTSDQTNGPQLIASCSISKAPTVSQHAFGTTPLERCHSTSLTTHSRSPARADHPRETRPTPVRLGRQVYSSSVIWSSSVQPGRRAGWSKIPDHNRPDDGDESRRGPSEIIFQNIQMAIRGHFTGGLVVLGLWMR